MTNASKGNQTHDRALIRFLLENRTFVNYMSILMIIYAVWATIEVITNATGATGWPPETGIPASEILAILTEFKTSTTVGLLAQVQSLAPSVP